MELVVHVATYNYNVWCLAVANSLAIALLFRNFIENCILKLASQLIGWLGIKEPLAKLVYNNGMPSYIATIIMAYKIDSIYIMSINNTL